MNSPPWTDIGRLQSDVNDLKSQLYMKADDYKIHETNSNVASLECSLREISTMITELQFNVQQLQEENERLSNRLCALEEGRE